MIRHVLPMAAALAMIAVAQAAEPQAAEPTNSGTASQLALELRACNKLDAPARDACKVDARQRHSYSAYAMPRPAQPSDLNAN